MDRQTRTETCWQVQESFAGGAWTEVGPAVTHKPMATDQQAMYRALADARGEQRLTEFRIVPLSFEVKV